MPDDNSNARFERIEAALQRATETLNQLAERDKSIDRRLDQLAERDKSIDRRLDRLTERHEALAESLELLTAAQRTTETRQQQLIELVSRLSDAMTRLAAVVQDHERRLGGLEGSQ